MNRTKFTLTSTILAAALGLALGLGAAPALAGAPDEFGCHTHKDCGTDSEGATIFDVSLEFLQVADGGTVIECRGDTDILANPGLTVNFDQGCFVEMTTDRKSPDDKVDMHLFRLEVKTKGSGIIEFVLNFTSDPDGLTHTNLWITDRLMAVVTEPDENSGEFDFVPSPLFPDAGEILTKGHQPDKGAETIKGVLIGIITYTPR